MQTWWPLWDVIFWKVSYPNNFSQEICSSGGKQTIHKVSAAFIVKNCHPWTSLKGAVTCLPRELTTVREVVYKQCSHMRRGRNACFNLCPCSSCGRPVFQLGFFAKWFWLEMEERMDNSQSIMSDDSIHSSQYSGPIAVLKYSSRFTW